MNLIDKLDNKNKIIVDAVKNEAVKQKVSVYIVGGPVRDLIMGNKIKDIDFLVEKDAIEFVKNSNFLIKSLHEDFKTAKIEINNEEIDVASTRSEYYPQMGCLPVLKEVGIKIEDDLIRRDFTVNAIAYDLINNKIIDPFNGQKDIENKILKVMHNKSYKDDPTRILRGLDFKYRFNFDFAKNDKILIEECISSFNREGLSIDRIYLTLNKVFSSTNACKILKDIINDEIYKIWTQKLGIQENEIEKLENAIQVFKVKEKNKLYLMALENCPYVKASFKNDFEIFEFFKKFSEYQLAFYYFKTGDVAAIKYLDIKNVKPFINGKILIEKGFAEGEIIGNILKELQKNKILYPEKFNTLEDELDFVFKNFEK